MVLFTKATQGRDYQGMFEHAEKLVPLYFKQFYDPERMSTEILYEMRTRMQRFSFDFLLTYKFKEVFDQLPSWANTLINTLLERLRIANSKIKV